jgi:acetyl esterase
MSKHLHPEARAVLNLMVERGVPPTHTLSPADARAFYLVRRSLSQPDPTEVAEVKNLNATSGVTGPHGNIPLRLYKPLAAAGQKAPAKLPVLVYFHGGGWVIGDLDTHDVLCRALCQQSGCAVVAVDYRMGPENRFPAAVDDCFAATQWVSSNAATLGLDPSKLAVGGDSAGGNLAAVVSIMARDGHGGTKLPIAFQLLIYPSTDMRRLTASHQSNGDGYLLTTDTISYFQNHYVGDEAKYLDWRASPLLASSHANLPPALVLTAGFDPLRDEGIDYAQKLTQAGGQSTHLSFERQIHGFITMGRLLQEANVAVSVCAAAVKQALV